MRFMFVARIDKRLQFGTTGGTSCCGQHCGAAILLILFFITLLGTAVISSSNCGWPLGSWRCCCWCIEIWISSIQRSLTIIRIQAKTGRIYVGTSSLIGSLIAYGLHSGQSVKGGQKLGDILHHIGKRRLSASSPS